MNTYPILVVDDRYESSIADAAANRLAGKHPGFDGSSRGGRRRPPSLPRQRHLDRDDPRTSELSLPGLTPPLHAPALLFPSTRSPHPSRGGLRVSGTRDLCSDSVTAGRPPCPRRRMSCRRDRARAMRPRRPRLSTGVPRTARSRRSPRSVASRRVGSTERRIAIGSGGTSSPYRAGRRRRSGRPIRRGEQQDRSLSVGMSPPTTSRRAALEPPIRSPRPRSGLRTRGVADVSDVVRSKRSRRAETNDEDLVRRAAGRQRIAVPRGAAVRRPVRELVATEPGRRPPGEDEDRRDSNCSSYRSARLFDAVWRCGGGRDGLVDPRLTCLSPAEDAPGPGRSRIAMMYFCDLSRGVSRKAACQGLARGRSQRLGREVGHRSDRVGEIGLETTILPAHRLRGRRARAARRVGGFGQPGGAATRATLRDGPSRSGARSPVVAARRRGDRDDGSVVADDDRPLWRASIARRGCSRCVGRSSLCGGGHMDGCGARSGQGEAVAAAGLEGTPTTDASSSAETSAARSARSGPSEAHVKVESRSGEVASLLLAVRGCPSKRRARLRPAPRAPASGGDARSRVAASCRGRLLHDPFRARCADGARSDHLRGCDRRRKPDDAGGHSVGKLDRVPTASAEARVDGRSPDMDPGARPVGQRPRGRTRTRSLAMIDGSSVRTRPRPGPRSRRRPR